MSVRGGSIGVRWSVRLLRRTAVICGLMLAAGCAPTIRTPSDSLVIVSRPPPQGDEFELRRVDWIKQRPVVSAIQRMAAAGPPLPLAITRGGTVVVQASAGGGNRLVWLGPGGGGGSGGARTSSNDGDSPRYDYFLDRVEGRLLLARYIRRAELPLRVERGMIEAISNPLVVIDACNVDDRTTAPLLTEAVTPIVRVAAGRWLILSGSGSQVELLDGSTGERRVIGLWEEERRVVAAVAAPEGQWAAIASQRVGKRWNLFHIDVWDARTNRITSLLKEDIFVANRPDSSLGPTLPMVALNERHLALVASRVTEWRDTLPVEGEYATLIANVPDHKVICRISHPQPGFRDATPTPYLPPQRLDALRIERIVVPGAASATAADDTDVRWRRFLTFQNGRLVTAGKQQFAPEELGAYTFSNDGMALALRRRVAADGQRDECWIFIDARSEAPISSAGIESLTWLPRRDAGAP